MKSILLFLTIIMVSGGLFAQTPKRSSKPKFDLSGSLRVSAQAFQTFGKESTQTPFIWSVSGSPVVSVLGIRFPMNFTYRDSKLKSNLAFPLSRFAASPSWKWGRIYLGQQALKFTPYTLSGRDFSGVGIELQPGILRLAVMKGSFRDLSTTSDSLRGLSVILPTYRRKGTAIKLGIGNPNTYLDFMVVKIKDSEDDFRYESDSFKNPKALPEDNLVGGIDMSVNLFKKLILKGHIAGSVHTSDIHSDSLIHGIDFQNEIPVLGSVEKLIVPRANTRWGKAIDASATLKMNSGSIGVQYKQVDPYYRSLGTFFVRNDVESWTSFLRVKTFKQKLQVRLRGGFERNNLANFRAVTQRRIIGSAQVTFIPSRRLIISASLSNFQLDNEAGIVELNDTLRMVRITRLQNLSVLLKGPERENLNWSLSGMANHQQVLDQSQIKSTGADFNLVNTTLALNLSWKKTGFRLSPNLNFRKTQSPIQQERLGIGLRTSQRILNEKLRFQTMVNYQYIPHKTEPSRQAVNVGMSIRYQIGKHHRFGLRTRYLNRNLSQAATTATLRSQFSYTFTF